jgi:hypothetical protein
LRPGNVGVIWSPDAQLRRFTDSSTSQIEIAAYPAGLAEFEVVLDNVGKE